MSPKTLVNLPNDQKSRNYNVTPAIVIAVKKYPKPLRMASRTKSKEGNNIGRDMIIQIAVAQNITIPKYTDFSPTQNGSSKKS